jgi:2'-5' RNA ligase
MAGNLKAEGWRLFVAVMVPEEIRDAMVEAQAEMRRALAQSRVGWTRAEQMHLTLKFLGDVEAPRVEELTEAIRSAVSGFGSLRLRAEGLGFFPNPRSPRVAWIGVRDEADALPRLQRAVEGAVGGFTAEKPESGFAGHVTLARIKALKRPEVEGLARLARGMAGRVFGEWTASTITIMRSEIQPSGARHTGLATVPLSG